MNSARRQSKSCKRCLRRKKRCHGFPVCTNCERANEPCEQSELSVQLHQRDDNYAAMQRIQSLEAQLENAQAELTALRDGRRKTSDQVLLKPGQILQNFILRPSPTPSSPNLKKSISPSHDAGARMIQSYLNTLHPRYPVLSPAELLRLHDRRHELVDAELDTFRLLIVYAIGGALQGDEGDYYATAVSYVPALQQQSSLVSLEVTVLLLLYNLYISPTSSTTLWHLVGLAMRTCIDLDLHRETAYSAEKDGNSHMRRLFWIVFCLDYSIAQGLRRPLGLAERDMDTRLPSPHVDTDADAFAFWVPFIQLRRLEACAYAEVYAVDEPIETRYSHAKLHLETLDAWAQKLPPLATEHRNNLVLLWKRAILVILQPFLGVLGHDAESLAAHCLRTAGEICEVVESMQKKGLHEHMLLAACPVFKAGITICFCLSLCPQLRSKAVLSSLAVCSSAMQFPLTRLTHLQKLCAVLRDAAAKVTDATPSTEHLAELDIVAVQGLMELAARHDRSLTPEVAATAATTPIINRSGGDRQPWGGAADLSDPLLSLHHPRSREGTARGRSHDLAELLSLELPAC